MHSDQNKPIIINMVEVLAGEDNLSSREKILSGVSTIFFDLDDSLYHTQYSDAFSDSTRKHSVK